MREILFRGKRKDNGNWIEGSLLNFRENTYIIPHNSEYCYDDTEKLAFDVEYFEVLPETVGQYTGLTDKNGKKIFEGDIVVDMWSEDKWIVTFDEGTFLGENVGDYAPEFLEELCDLNEKGFGGVIVIGNIHYNPELTEVNKND